MRKLLMVLLSLMMVLGISSASADVDLPADLTVIEEYAFRYDASLTGALIIPEGVTMIGREAFYDCDGITSLTLPEGIRSIENGAFMSCGSLTGTVEVAYDVFVDRFAFYGTDVTFVRESLPEFTDSPECFFTHDQYTLGSETIRALMYRLPLGVTEVRVPATYAGDKVEYIAPAAFSDAELLRSVSIPDSVKMIDTSCFRNCPDLETVIVPASVTLIGAGCFENCPKVNVVVERGSEAHSYCRENNIPYIVTGEPVDITVWVRSPLVDLVQEKADSVVNQLHGYRVVVEEMGEGDAAERKAYDPTGGADIFVIAQDPVERLVSAGALDTVPSTGFFSRFGESPIQGVVGNGVVYGYPLTADNGYFMYYDKSVLSDPTSLEKIIADCEAAGKKIYFELNSGWYAASFFFGEGCTIDFDVNADGSFSSLTCNLATSMGVRALRNMIRLASSPAFVCGSSFSSATDVGMIVDGTWDYYTALGVLGENLGAAKLPAAGGNLLIPFSGGKYVCVKPQTDEEKAAEVAKLAEYLASAEMQGLYYQEARLLPADLQVQQTLTDLNASEAALLSQINDYARPQGIYPGEYWTLMMELGNAVMAGAYDNYTDEQLLEVLYTLQVALSETF